MVFENMERKVWTFIGLSFVLLFIGFFFLGITTFVGNDEVVVNTQFDSSGMEVSHPPDLELLSTDPTNHTISWTLSEDGALDYLGLYSFTYDEDGTVPGGWEDLSHPDSKFKVVSSVDGHHKVARLRDLRGTVLENRFGVNKTEGTIELFWRTSCSAKIERFRILDNDIEIFGFRVSDRDYFSDDKPWCFGLDSNQWYHFRIDWNSTGFQVWIDGVLYGAGCAIAFFAPMIDGVDAFRLRTWDNIGYNVFVDAVDYSWAPGYYLNRNRDYAIINTTYAIFEDETQKTNVYQLNESLQVDYNVSGLRLGDGFHNISLRFNDSLGRWYQDDVLVRVTPPLDYPILYPILPNPNTIGLIDLNWNDMEGATTYYIYRATALITSVDGMTPIARVSLSNYQDILFNDGTYYYAIIAGNCSWNSSVSNCESVEVAKLHPIFDGLYMNHSITVWESGDVCNITYSHVSGSIFHVSAVGYYGESSSSWDVDVQTRIISNKTTCANLGSYTPFWIFTNVSLNDAVVLGGYGSKVFNVIAETVYFLPSVGFVEAWRLKGGGASDVVAWYEKSTGVLLEGNFYAGMPCRIHYDFVDTNAELNTVNYTQTPVLNPISPNPDYDGIIDLNWDNVVGAATYYVYRATSPITSVDSMIPIATVSTNNYQDIINDTGIYYYVIVAGNLTGNSSSSNCESVEVAKIHPLFDGMYIQYDIRTGWGESWQGLFNYSYISNDFFHVTDESGGDFYNVNVKNRLIMPYSISNKYFFQSEVHSPLWIFPNVSLGDEVLIGPFRDFTFVVTGESFYTLPGIGFVETWVLDGGNNRKAWYEKSTGILLKGDFHLDGMVAHAACRILFDFVDTNAELNTVNYTPTTVLDPISPNPDYDGIIELNWNKSLGATYYIYRDTSIITSVVGMTPIGTVSKGSYTDTITSNGTYYYVIAMGNTSISNCESVVIPPLNPPILDPILPNQDFDGIIELNWNDVIGVTKFYIYRDSSLITSVDGITPIAAVSKDNYQDTLTSDGIYFYVIVASNIRANSSLSNCESVLVAIPNPNTPVLQPISPKRDFDGNIELNWNDVVGVIIYYVYRASSPITSVDGITPIAVVSESNYQDTLTSDGTYYYVIVAGNIRENSSLSNCEGVLVTNISTPSAIDPPILILIIIAIIATIGISLILYSRLRQQFRRSRGQLRLTTQREEAYGSILPSHQMVQPIPRRVNCNNCGIQNEADGFFCTYCGSELYS